VKKRGKSGTVETKNLGEPVGEVFVLQVDEIWSNQKKGELAAVHGKSLRELI